MSSESSVDRAVGQRQRDAGRSASNSAKQPAAVGLGQQLAHGRQTLAQPRAEPLQVGQHGVGDVLLGLLGELDPLDVQLVADQRGVLFEPRLMRGVGQNDLDAGSAAGAP